MKRHLRRFVPSPAMVVALTALFLALGGSAYALVITGKSIRNNTVSSVGHPQRHAQVARTSRRTPSAGRRSRRPRLGPVPSAGIAFGDARFAVVSGAGAVARQRSVSSAARTATGRYQVIFTSDVRNCAYYATVGDTSASPLQTGAQITTASLALERERRGGAHLRIERRGRRPAVPPARQLLSSGPGGPSADGSPATSYSTFRSTRAGAPAATEKAGTSSVTTLLAPITQRSPIVTPLATTTFAPHQTLSPTRVGPLLAEALPGHRAVGIVEAVVSVGDEAAVGEHAVLADLHQPDRRPPSRRC